MATLKATGAHVHTFVSSARQLHHALLCAAKQAARSCWRWRARSA